MYYRNVNRGVSFTKAGKYTIGLVFLLGLVATGSGFNGLFLALSFSLAVLVISGIQSEAVMKFLEVEGLSHVEVDAGKPFRIDWKIRNHSAHRTLYGVESFVVNTSPKFKLWSMAIDPQIEATLLELPGGTRRWVAGQSSGMPRGLYQELLTVQSTQFPFGLLHKFKVQKVPSHLRVLPAKDNELEARFQKELFERLSGDHKEQDFYSHRSYLPGDSLRHVDWRKAAGLELSQWAVKTYAPTGEDAGVMLSLSWESLKALSHEATYERAFVLLRTMAEVVYSSGRPLVLQLGPQAFFQGRERVMEALSRAPHFEKRTGAFSWGADPAPRGGTYWQVQVQADQYHWMADRIRARVA